MRLVIVDGPDGGGKTTFINQLVDHYGFETLYHDQVQLKNGVPIPSVGKFETYTQVVRDARRRGRNFVIDRFYLTEIIYGQVMRNGDIFGPHRRVLIERFLRSLSAKTVICLPGLDQVQHNWAEKRKLPWDMVKKTGDYVDRLEKITSIYRLFSEEVDKNWELIGYNYNAKPTDEAGYDRVIEQVMTNPRRLPYQVIGDPFAKFLIVGEQINHKRQSFGLPFYSQEADSSSAYLTKAIVEAGLSERQLAFVNAVTPAGQVTDRHRHRHRRKSSGHRNLRTVVKALPQFQRCVALGKTAARVCSEQNLPYIEVPHPSFWKKFRHHDLHDYSVLLAEACRE